MTTDRFAAAALVLALVGCASARPMQNVPLMWKPTDDVSATTNAIPRTLTDRHVQVMPFTDERDLKTLIGRNVEKPQRPLDVSSQDDVGAWCADQMKALLKQSGVEVVGSQGALVVTGQVTEFFVNEGDVYEGQVALRLTVGDRAGNKLWKGVVTGRSKRWGRSYQKDNYFEVLSDAYLHAVQEMFRDESFRVAVARRS